MNKLLKIILFGAIAWLIPFAFSFLFYTKGGQLIIDVFLFKSIIIVFASACGALLLVKYFKSSKGSHFKDGILIGAIWFTLHIVLDMLILVPMSGASLGEYFTQIGLRYLLIPIMSISMGYLAEK